QLARVGLAEEVTHRRHLLLDPLRELERVARALADKAGCSGDSVCDHIRSATAGLRDRLRAALHGGRQPAFRVRERHDDLLVGAARLDDLAVLRQLVLAQRDPQLSNRDRDRDEAGHRLRGLCPPSKVDLGQSERILARAHRIGIVLPRQAWHRAEPSGASFPRPRRCGGGGFALRHGYARPVTATLIDGKALGAKVREEVAASVAELGHVGLATVLVGDDPASHIYIDLKQKAAQEAGMNARALNLPADTSGDDLLFAIAELNADDEVDGVLVQLPLPDHIDENRIIEAISPEKDVDGIHPINAGRLYLGRPTLVPGTPLGIMRMLDEYEIPL